MAQQCRPVLRVPQFAGALATLLSLSCFAADEPGAPTGAATAAAPPPSVAAAAGASARAQPIPPGHGRQTIVVGSERVEVFTWRPANWRDGPLLLLLHDADGDAALLRDQARTLADRHGYLLAAPQLGGAGFPFWRYPWAGIARRSFADDGVRLVAEPPQQRLDALLRPLIDALRSTGEHPLPYALLGVGDGAQALIRWAAFATQEAIHIALVTPGRPLLPTRRVDYPDGFGGLPAALASETRLRDYVALPVTLIAGRPPASTVPGAAGDRPLERALNARNAVRQAALERNRAAHWRVVEVPDAGDDVRRLLASPLVAQALLPLVGTD